MAIRMKRASAPKAPTPPKPRKPTLKGDKPKPVPNPRAGGGYGGMGNKPMPPTSYKTPHERRVARPGPHGGGPTRQGVGAVGRRTSPRRKR